MVQVTIEEVLQLLGEKELELSTLRRQANAFKTHLEAQHKTTVSEESIAVTKEVKADVSTD